MRNFSDTRCRETKTITFLQKSHCVR